MLLCYAAERAREVESLQQRLTQFQADQSVMDSLSTDFANLQRDFALKSEEAERHYTAWSNLNTVLESYQSDTHSRQQQIDKQLEESRVQAELAKRALAEVKDTEQRLVAATSQSRTLRDQLTAAQKYVLKLENENSTLRKGFEQTMIRLKNLSGGGGGSGGGGENDTVDRRVVVKMWLTYFERRDKDEVLELISRILGFTNAEKQKYVQM